jgi:hypothetical protein
MIGLVLQRGHNTFDAQHFRKDGLAVKDSLNAPHMDVRIYDVD